MIHAVNPQQTVLFDFDRGSMSKIAFERLGSSMYAVIRHVILELMPVDKISIHFDPTLGRPTKELYSMMCLILLKEFKNWTTDETVDAYLFDKRVHYALNMGSGIIEFSSRTLERYMALLRGNSVAIEVFNSITKRLIELLGIEIDQQRLDSTHVFSDMATFARTKLMGTTIKKFIVQLKRHQPVAYSGLPERIRSRYEKSVDGMFASANKDSVKRSFLRQEVAEQMHQLIQAFCGNATIENMQTYKNLVTVFTQQCEVIDVIEVTNEGAVHDASSSDKKGTDKQDKTNTDVTPKHEEKVSVREKTGGNVVQNPSDMDATFDGHKGPGYQVQIAETCNTENEVQLVTAVVPQTASESDAHAVSTVLEKLLSTDRLPEEMLSDTAYCGDDNVTKSASIGVDLVGPVPGKAPKEPIKNPTEKQKRLQTRRELEKTQEWLKNYNRRAQIEGTIGSIKRLTSMVRIRYRGSTSMYASMILKITGWNISRAHQSVKIQKIVANCIARIPMYGAKKDQIKHLVHMFATLAQNLRLKRQCRHICFCAKSY